MKNGLLEEDILYLDKGGKYRVVEETNSSDHLVEEIHQEGRGQEKKQDVLH